MRAAADWFFTSDPSTFGMFFVGDGALNITITEFTATSGCLIVEQTSNGGGKWTPLNMTKVGRGMATCAVATGPALLRCHLWQNGNACGVRIRDNGLRDMDSVEVTFSFADIIARQILRGASQYVIQETPDLRDLMI